MNWDVIVNLKTALVSGWEEIPKKGFTATAPGVSIEICDKKEFKKGLARFDLQLNDERSKAYAGLLAKHGISEVRGPFSSILDGANDDVLNLARGILPAIEGVFLSSNFLFHYVALGEKSRVGEAILAYFPYCGIPCGWNENEGSLYIYQPELKA